MNWKEIIELYPKSYKILDQLSCIEIEGYIFDDRELYDFFDKQNIIITIEGYLLAGYIVNEEATTLYKDDPLLTKYKSRSDCEEFIFLKAFKILENKLIKNEKLDKEEK